MRSRERVRSALAVLMSLSLAMPPYTAYAEDIQVEGGVDASKTVIENGVVVEGSVGDNVILASGNDDATAVAQQGEQLAAGEADQQGDDPNDGSKVSKAKGEGTVKTWYTDADGNRQDITAVPLSRFTTELKPNTWYVVAGSFVNENRLTVTGENTNIILADGCRLELTKGIFVDTTNGNHGELNIWGQSDMAGEMIATAASKDQAGIGGNPGTGNGDVRIYNGVITAKGKQDGAGIGGGENGCGGNVAIYGGSVTASADELGAGIGCGYAKESEVDGGSITIAGGKVVATGGKDNSHGSAGIGGGARGNAGTIEISGGDVTANGGKLAAGIGSGDAPRGTGGTIEISGGTVNATAGAEGAGIGGGKDSHAGEQISISGGTVNASCSGDYGAGIGGGNGGSNGLITISGGTVSATAGLKAAGIGAGSNADAEKIEISGGNVTATGGANGAGIGGGVNHGNKEIVISGAETSVTATGGVEAAGIGSADEGEKGVGSGSVSIKGGATVTATGGDLAAGIGGGDNCCGARVTIAGEGTAVTAIGGKNAAGIGGGEGKNGNHVDISDLASVTAEGKDGCPAIGAGKGGKDNCETSIYPTCMVSTSDKDADAVKADKRRETLRAPYVRLVPCQHTGDHQYERTEKTHKFVCGLCDFVSEENPHDFDENGKCRVCGNATIDTYYINQDGDETPLGEGDYKVLDKKSVPDTSTSSGLKGGWYVVNEDQTYDNRISVKGDVNLVLADGAKLTMNKGIYVDKTANSRAKLTIWGQKDNSGTLEATGSEGNAGIGGNAHTRPGDIEIFGAHISATGGKDAAGIGSGSCGDSANITIHGGTIDAKGADHGAGIGGSHYGKANAITIEGGTITAQGGNHAAAIGSGGGADADCITIKGGTIKAFGGNEAAGVGTGDTGKIGTIDISGGDVIAIGGTLGAGVGTGDGKNSTAGYETINISGDATRVRAYGGNEAAGIGCGNECGDRAGVINIFGGAEVIGVGGTKDQQVQGDDVIYTHDKCDSGAGIGGADDTNAGSINIYGDGTNVCAEGASEAAGIGSGDEGKDAGEVNITDGAYVKATGGKYAAGIGGGDHCNGAKVTMCGERTFVEAIAGSEAAGIGGGRGKGGNEVTLDGGAGVRAAAGDGAQAIGAGKNGLPVRDTSKDDREFKNKEERQKFEEELRKFDEEFKKSEGELKLYEGVCVRSGSSEEESELVDIYDADKLQFQKLTEGCRAPFAQVGRCDDETHEASEWHRGKEKHQHVCKHCGVVMSEEAHDPDFRGYCRVCGYDHCPIEYIDACGNTAYTDGDYTILSDVADEDGVTLEGGCYVVCTDNDDHDYDNTFSHRLNIAGDVTIILCDDATLTCLDGIRVESDTRLTIWGQKKNTGKLVATTTKEVNENRTERCAAIGSNDDEYFYTGTIAIFGGVIEAASDGTAAAIGGGAGSPSGTIVIGGKNTVVTATAGERAAAIGGGFEGKANSVTIEGGTVNAKGGEYAAGIGGGGNADADYIAIKGGTVKAFGGKESAGIGSANTGRVGTIDITGGDVTAIGADKAAGIGAGDGENSKGGSYDAINILGGNTHVRAYGGNEAAGIGSGNLGQGTPGSITISGGASVTAIGGAKNATLQDDGNVTYTSGSYGAGIGGGDTCSSGTISITGSMTTVYAKGAENGAGIGGGDRKGADTITIEEATVTAKGGDHAAGIGGGRDGGASKIAIHNAKVEAWGGKEAAGIGSGTKGKAESIEISGADVLAVGGDKGAGIGGARDKNGAYGTISIAGDATHVRAYGGNKAAGIGCGNDCGDNAGSISIAGGADVTAVGGTKDVVVGDDDAVTFTHDGCDAGAGIGGAYKSGAGTITIAGAGTAVRAEGAAEAAGIGSGDESKDAGTITIADGADVRATGGKLAAGIGGGDNCDGGKVTISGTNTHVEATGGSEAAGIGGGQQRRGGKVAIENGATVKVIAGEGGSRIGAGKGNQDGFGVESSPDGKENKVKKCKDNGSISLYPTASVTIDGDGSLAPGIWRAHYCAMEGAGSLTIAPCHHAGAKFQTNSEGHVAEACKYCAACGGKDFEPHVFGEDHKCDICGYELDGLAFTGVTPSTDGKLGITFWVHFPETDGAEDAQGESAADRTVELAIDGKWKRSVKVDAGNCIRNKRGDYGVFFSLSALELAAPVKATVVRGHEVVEKTSSFRECMIDAQRARWANPDAFTDAEWNYLWASANLGHFVQPWLASCNKLNAGADFVAMDLCKAAMNDVAAAKDAAEFYQQKSNVEGSGVKKVTISVMLDSALTFRVYLTPEQGKSLTACVQRGDVKDEARKLKDGRYLIEVKDVMPESFGDEFVVKGTCDKDFTVSSSVLAYLNAAMHSDTCSDECTAALAAIYNYYKCAKEFH